MKLTAILSVFMMAWACNKDDAKHYSEGEVTINVNIQDDVFDDNGTLENFSPRASVVSSEIAVQRNEIAIGNGLYLDAVLEKDVDKSTGPQSRGVPQIGKLMANIMYKVAVYDSQGVYVTSIDYVYGKESNSPKLLLNGGKNYTFIAYSINSVSNVPALVFSNNNNKTLATSTVNVTGSRDFMYFRKNMTVSGISTNNLDIVLSHKFSEITTIIDASAVGYNVDLVTSTFRKLHMPSASIALGNGSITRSGNIENVSVIFPSLGTQVVTSRPNIINSASGISGEYHIQNIKIGAISTAELKIFSNLFVSPGVKYNLKINISSQDGYTTMNGIPVAKINGQIWARHNLGANVGLDPNQVPSQVGLIGNYYQYGKSKVAATATTAWGNIPGWVLYHDYDYVTTPLGVWNAGTETSPRKAVSDPCPTGFRIPTMAEFSTLIASTTYSNIGPGLYNEHGGSTFYWPEGRIENFQNAKVLTSKRNANIKLSFPMAGYRDFLYGREVNIAASAVYWSTYDVINGGVSRGKGNLGVYWSHHAGTEVYLVNGNNATASNIKCIKE